MKRVFLTLALIFALSYIIYAGPGDTLRLKSHEDVTIKTDPSVGRTNYAGWVNFPKTDNVRKIIAELTFECAPGLQCGEWDYLNHIYVRRIGGESGETLSWEIARFITPYGFYWHAKDNWSHSWEIDVTNWAALLQDSVEIVYTHTGYESNNDRGWKINLEFQLIEGQPIRKPVKITPLWNSNYVYGNPNNPFSAQVSPIDVELNPATTSADFFILQTGHGNDSSDGCAEFCSKERRILLDGEVIAKRDIWKQCGDNSLYPQAGTWLLDRGNWCPGDIVTPDRHTIFNLSGGSTHTFDLQMQQYEANSEYGNYVISSYLIEYEDIASANDVSLARIISPSTAKQNLRFNPRCNEAIIEIENSGSEPLTTVDINYGTENNMQEFHWEGNLEFGEKEKVYLFIDEDWILSDKEEFTVILSNPNGVSDENPYDNTGTSVILPVETLPAEFVVKFKSTKANEETMFKIVKSSTGEVVFERDGFLYDNEHFDTIRLEENTCYRLLIDDDGTPLPGGIDVPRDGLQFWYWASLYNAYPQFRQYIDNKPGFLQLFSTEFPKMIKNVTAGTRFSGRTTDYGDFGSFLEYSFITEKSTSVKSSKAQGENMKIYPNPAGTEFYVNLEDLSFKALKLDIYNAEGQVVYQQDIRMNEREIKVNASDLTAGIYYVNVKSGQNSAVKQVVINGGGK